MLHIRYHTILICLFCLFSAQSATQSVHAQNARVSQTAQNKIIKSLDKFKKRNRLVSLSFAFFHGDDVNFDYTTGYSNSRRRVKATPEHVYTIASVTKAITGMTMVDLVHQNYLSLGDSVHRLIKGFPENVTVLDLLNHTSGFLREKENEHFLTNSSYLRPVDYLPVKFNLKIHRYANYNYAVAGAVIARVSGKLYKDAAAAYFHSITGGDPLYFSNYSTNGALRTNNYVRKGRRLISHEPVDFGLWEPAAFAQTTAKSLTKFLRYHMTSQFIEFIESHSVTIRRRRGSGDWNRECYALGFRLRYKDDRLQYVFHNGFLYGVISTLYYFPQKDAGFVALSNMSSYPHQRLGLGGLFRSVEEIIDEEFNSGLAHYTADSGFEEGLLYYESNKSLGEAREKILSRIANDYLKKKENVKAIRLLKLSSYLFPESSGVHRTLAEVYASNGQEELAEKTRFQSMMALPQMGSAK